jgi:hypothetical protein
MKHIKISQKGRNRCTLLCVPLYLLSLTHTSHSYLSFFLYVVSPLFVLSSFLSSFLSCYFIVSVYGSSALSLLPRLSSTFSVYMYVNLTGSFKNILLTTLAVYIFPLNILCGSKLSSKRCFMGKGGGKGGVGDF